MVSSKPSSAIFIATPLCMSHSPQRGPQPATSDRMPQLMMVIVGETCSTVAEPSAVRPPVIGARVLTNSGLVGALRATPPGGLTVLAIAPVKTENAEIETG